MPVLRSEGDAGGRDSTDDRRSPTGYGDTPTTMAGHMRWSEPADYYPKKLRVASTRHDGPAPGPRLLRPARDRRAGHPASGIGGAAGLPVARSVIGPCDVLHRRRCAGLGEAGWLQRVGMQFRWRMPATRHSGNFLGALSSRKRKVLRRERRDANAAGLTFHALNGADIKEAHWDAFYRFYRSTVDRKWGSAYLSRSFFSLLGERLGDRVVLMLAENAGKPVAGALNLAGSEALYGRNWGCRGDWPFLHFELCYYRAIDWAIEHGLQRVEAGAQGATRSSAAICRSRRIRRIGSRIPGCAGRSPIIWKTSVRAFTRERRHWRNSRRSARATKRRAEKRSAFRRVWCGGMRYAFSALRRPAPCTLAVEAASPVANEPDGTDVECGEYPRAVRVAVKGGMFVGKSDQASPRRRHSAARSPPRSAHTCRTPEDHAAASGTAIPC